MVIKKIFFVFLLLCSIKCTAQTGTTILDSIMSNGVYRTYRLYKPSIYNASKAVPMVFNFHGFTSNAAAQEGYGDFRKIADTANFIIVHPQGLSITALGTTGPGWTNFDAVSSPNKDIEFISTLIDDIITKYTIDLNRIYSCGMSNGGYMSYDMACFLSSRIAAVASVTGSMNVFHKNGCQANHPTPIMQIHGTNDGTVLYGGTPVAAGIEELVQFWVNFNNCGTTPTFKAIPNTNLSDNCTAEQYVYSGGDDGSTVEFFKIIGGDHSWPGAPVNINTTNMDFSASKEIWRFFSQYKLTIAINEEKMEENPISIYPNPSNGQFNLTIKKYNSAHLQISNVFGEVLFSTAITSPSMNINLNAFAKGLYFYSIRNASEILGSGKIIID